MVKKEQRDKRIENLRALAIVLVVFGHSIILYQKGWGLYETERSSELLNLIKSWINMIQMPLFFSLSGYLFYFSIKKANLLNMIQKKIRRILIPFFIIAVGWLIPIRKLVGWSNYKGKNLPDILLYDIIGGRDCGHLWFLPCLFLIFIISYLIISVLKKVIKNENIVNVLFGAVSYMAAYFFYLIPEFYGSDVIRSVAINLIWFCAGYLLCAYAKVYKNMKKWQLILLLIASVLVSIGVLTGNFIYSKIPGLVLLITLYAWIPQTTNGFVEFLSKNSLGIYLFHSPLVYLTYSHIPNANPALVIGINFIIFGALAAGITVLIRKLNLKVVIGE